MNAKNTNEVFPCERTSLVRDYAFEELAVSGRQSMEQHLAQCSCCTAELDRLRLTISALHVLPDQEPPRRIAFVSDKVFRPGWFHQFWNSAAQLGFAAACVLSVGLSFAALHRQPEPRTIIQTTGISRASIDEAVAKAVAVAVDRTHAEDIQMTKAALDAVDKKYEQKQENLMVAMQSSLDYMRKRYQQTALASYSGAGQ